MSQTLIAISDFQRALLVHIIAAEIVNVGRELRRHEAERRVNIVAHCKLELTSLRDMLDKVEKCGVNPYSTFGAFMR